MRVPVHVAALFPYTTLFRSRGVGFRQVGGVRRHNGGVVGAEDVDGDRARGAVGARNRETVGVGGAGDELVMRRARGVAPRAVRVDRELAVAAGRIGLGYEMRVAVDVADAQRPGG